MLKILFCGDVVGHVGRQAVRAYLPALKAQLGLEVVIINAENAAGGFGLTADTARELFNAGADVLTLGDHAWDKKEAETLLERDPRILRPYNFPGQNPGQGFRVFDLAGRRVAVLNLLGRAFIGLNLDALQCQYRLGIDYDVLMVDLHCEATAEAVCLGHLWDGKASLISGSHTHIPTADAHIMPAGTGYHTDAGMCGFYDSSLGMQFAGAMARFEQGRRQPLTLAEGPGTLCGTYAEINDQGLCTKIEMVRVGGVLPPTHQVG